MRVGFVSPGLWCALGAWSSIVVAGCVDGATPAGGHGIELVVAPLELEGIDYACYDILVEHAGATYKQVGGGNDVVVLGDPTTMGGGAASGAICSNRYGNGGGGDITYVATCDASADADTVSGGTVQNKVTLWVDGLYRGGVDISTDPNQVWQNPCPTGCAVDFDCVENRDTQVEFNLTIMRSANQGFFDVAVNFEDVFCSAKVDCRYTAGQAIRLVYGASGERIPTAVAAVACTGGDAVAGDAFEDRTHMYASDLVVECDTDRVFPVDLEGNLVKSDDERVGPVEQVVVSRGLESLLNGAADADPMYWTVAVGFDESDDSTIAMPVISGGECWLKWKVAVSKGPIQDVFALAHVTYPYIDMNVQITDGDGAWVCAQHPANGGNGVGTVYTELGAELPADFRWHMFQDANGVMVQGMNVAF